VLKLDKANGTRHWPNKREKFKSWSYMEGSVGAGFMTNQHAIRAVFGLLVLFCCAFLACTASAVEPEAQTGIARVILVGPIHGGPSRAGIPDSKPLANVSFVVAKEDATVGSFRTDNEGRFRISIPPGHYTVSTKEKRGRIGHFGPFEVDVSEGKTTDVQWSCDTGMR
jgi:hypothetical protein